MINNFYIHELFESAFHKQEKGDYLLKYVGSIIMPKEHIKKVLLDQKMEDVIYKYWQDKKQEDDKELKLMQDMEKAAGYAEDNTEDQKWEEVTKEDV